MKKYLFLFLASALFFGSLPVCAQGSDKPPAEIRFTIGSPIFQADGEELPIDTDNNEVVPFVDPVSGCTMIPLRLFAELLNFKVNWSVECPEQIILCKSRYCLL